MGRGVGMLLAALLLSPLAASGHRTSISQALAGTSRHSRQLTVHDDAGADVHSCEDQFGVSNSGGDLGYNSHAGPAHMLVFSHCLAMHPWKRHESA